MTHKDFITTSRGLRRDTLPMRLFEKAKRLGWNPSDIDFNRDAQDWKRLSSEEQDLLLRLTALFQAGEEAVTLDLLPLMLTVAQEGQLEEGLFLSSFLWDEARHTDLFQRFLDNVVCTTSDLSSYHTAHYRALVYEALPQAMQKLLIDQSHAAQIEAIVTYNLIVEGVLAETGYYGASAMLERHQILPGHQQGIKLLQRDESRHIAYGIYKISQLIGIDDELWKPFEQTIQRLIPLAIGVIDEIFLSYDPVPFGLVGAEFINYAAKQVERRIASIAQTRKRNLSDVDYITYIMLDDEVL